MKTILVDCRFAGLNAGLGRYTRELLIHLLKRPQTFRYLLLVRRNTESWIPDGAQTILADVPHYSLQEQTVLPGIIRRSRADLLFSPHFNVPLICPLPFVVTVHDLILHRYPNNASILKQMLYRVLIGHAVKSAKAIVAVSDFTKQELSDAYGSAIVKKITPIMEGVSDIYKPVSDQVAQKVLQRLGITRPYFLYVGNAKQHKNVQMLIDAFAESGVTDADLVLVTGGPESRALTLRDNVRTFSNIADEDLPALYSAARSAVTASLYEGYCLPVAEALACACPVIATNHPVIAETAQGHAMLVEPTVEAFAAAFKHPPTDRTRHIVGTWEKAAEETETLLKTVVR